MKNYWTKENQEKLQLQHKTINSIYGWNKRSEEWKNFLSMVKKK